MESPLAAEGPVLAVPQFYVTPSQRFSLRSFLLAIVTAVAFLLAVVYALGHSRYAHAGREDDDDDPSRVDTIYLGDPGQAPRAARPQEAHPSAVHPFVVVRLPRSGEQFGQIPDTAAGRLLYAWLAAFNGTDSAALPKALPTAEPTATQAAQLELRRQTGGFTLVSAKEVQPGVLVFRLHDQTPSATEALGTLQVRPNSNPATIASFSLSGTSSPEAKPNEAARANTDDKPTSPD